MERHIRDGTAYDGNLAARRVSIHVSFNRTRYTPRPVEELRAGNMH